MGQGRSQAGPQYPTRHASQEAPVQKPSVVLRTHREHDGPSHMPPVALRVQTHSPLTSSQAPLRHVATEQLVVVVKHAAPLKPRMHTSHAGALGS